MPSHIMVIGLDAAEATLLERWGEDGDFPAMARLLERGAVCHLTRNPLETLPGAIWPELTTGIAGAKLGQYHHPLQIHSGEARLREITEDEIDPEKDYWSHASRAGARVAVIDATQTVPNPGLNGVQVIEWGVHDRQFTTRSRPPGCSTSCRSATGRIPSTCATTSACRSRDAWAFGKR